MVSHRVASFLYVHGVASFFKPAFGAHYIMKAIAPTDFPTGECEIKVARTISYETPPPAPSDFNVACM